MLTEILMQADRRVSKHTLHRISAVISAIKEKAYNQENWCSQEGYKDGKMGRENGYHDKEIADMNVLKKRENIWLSWNWKKARGNKGKQQEMAQRNGCRWTV